MKAILTFLFFSLIINFSYSQTDSTNTNDSLSWSRIELTNGGEIIAKILSENDREIYVQRQDDRKVYLPQHTIKSITKLNNSDFSDNGKNYIGEDAFATRYFLTTNAIPIKKGENYVQWNLWGPDFQFGLGKGVGVGVMTSWFGMPLIGNIKKSFELNEKTNFAIGTLLGTGSWAAPDFAGALPFATLSTGSRTKNIAVSGGYGIIKQGDEVVKRGLASIAGMVKVHRNFSLVFDSFILLPTTKEITQGSWDNQGNWVEFTSVQRVSAVALIIPGVRWHQNDKKAFQFGFTGIYAEEELLPVPIPTVQWFRSF